MGMSALLGGIRLLMTDGMGMPKTWLSNTPFDSYFWPGLILAGIVGGTYIMASITMWRCSKLYPELSGIAGFGLIIWIFTEVFLLPGRSLLQITYFGIGILTVVLDILILRNKPE